MAAGNAGTPTTGPGSSTSVIMFEYIGAGAASIRGQVSGQLYRFGQTGDRIRVDPRDRPGLSVNSMLRWVR
jgi:hypothetical protein